MVNINRRRALGLLGASIFATSTVPTTTTAREEGELPNDLVNYSEVLPFNCEKYDFCNRKNPQEVPEGNWIVHTWAWVPGARNDEGELCGDAKKQKEYLEKHLKNAKWEVQIDGVAIENPEQYWAITYSEELKQWILRWEYATPPKEPEMTHTFTRKKQVTERHRVGWEQDSCDQRYIEPGVEQTTGKYVVVERTG